MGAVGSKLQVAVDGPRAIVRVCGRASVGCSTDFKTLVYDLHGRGGRRFVLELSDCTIMDSTFVGILARFAQVLSTPGEGRGELVLWNPAARIVELLDNLGVLSLFLLEQNQPPMGASCQDVPAAPAADPAERVAVALQAHQDLVALHPANAVKFKDVIQFMAEDLKKIGTKS